MWMIGMVFSMVSLPKTQRLLLGLFVLLIVDLIWVATSELPKVSDLYLAQSSIYLFIYSLICSKHLYSSCPI